MNESSPAEDQRTFPPCPRCGSKRERSYYCRKCGPERKAAWAAANPEKVRAQNDAQHRRTRADPALRDLRNRQKAAGKFGLTVTEYDALIDASGGVCAICGGVAWRPDGRRPSLDHNHETGQLRGVLCGNCNVAIGHFREDPNLLRAAISYLDHYASLADAGRARFVAPGGEAKRRRRAIGQWTYESGAGWRHDVSGALLVFKPESQEWTVDGRPAGRYLRAAIRNVEEQTSPSAKDGSIKDIFQRLRASQV